MDTDRLHDVIEEDLLGCLGDFCTEDNLCKKWCALSLRCAIERDQNARLEMLDELVAPDSMFLKVQ